MNHWTAGAVPLMCGAKIMRIPTMYLCRYTIDMFYTKNTNMSQLIMGGVPCCYYQNILVLAV